MNGLVKQDINFMEYALYVQDDSIVSKSEDGYTWKDRNGYVYQAGYKPPTKIDFIFLLYLLMRSQQNDWNNKMSLTKYEILKECGVANPGKHEYKRLVDGLKRWSMVKLEFQGTFYNGKKYETLVFGIIDTYSIEDDSKNVEVTLSPQWLYKIKESNFFKHINFKQVKSLRSPLNIRLYEILIKSFQGRYVWKIDAIKLADKIPMKEKHVSHIVAKITGAVNRINTLSDFNVKLIVQRSGRGKALLIFEKISKEKAEKLLSMAGLPDDDDFKAVVHLLPEEHKEKKTVLELINKAYRKHGSKYAVRNVQYTTKHCKGNYRAYLAKALKSDWGLAIQEDEEVKEKKRSEAKEAAEIKHSEQKAEEVKSEEKNKEYNEKFSRLSREEQENVINLTFEKMKSNSYAYMQYKNQLAEGLTIDKMSLSVRATFENYRNEVLKEKY